jgi:hypothetical protein
MSSANFSIRMFYCCSMASGSEVVCRKKSGYIWPPLPHSAISNVILTHQSTHCFKSSREMKSFYDFGTIVKSESNFLAK